MAVDVRFLGQSCFELKAGGTTVLTDPFLTGNPLAAATATEVEPDVILLTHGHGDHLGDTVDIAKRTGATVVAIVELAAEISGDGVADVRDPNYGGTVVFDWGWVKLVQAFHTNTTPSGEEGHEPFSAETGTSIGLPAGLVVNIGGVTVYHAGDTCLFGDMKLIAERTPLDVAIVPIGGHYTMGVDDAAYACGLLDAGTVLPMHYDTFPAIEADAGEFKQKVESGTDAEVVVLEPGGTHTV